MEDLVDIMVLLRNVYLCNDRLHRMMETEAPEIIKRLGRMQLQLAVEHLASNCHSDKPLTGADGNMLVSLSCIGYHLKTKEVEE